MSGQCLHCGASHHRNDMHKECKNDRDRNCVPTTKQKAKPVLRDLRRYGNAQQTHCSLYLCMCVRVFVCNLFSQQSYLFCVLFILLLLPLICSAWWCCAVRIWIWDSMSCLHSFSNEKFRFHLAYLFGWVSLLLLWFEIAPHQGHWDSIKISTHLS